MSRSPTPNGVGNSWEIFTHGGRTPSGKDAVKFAVEMVERGAGELMVTSMDQDGTRSGYDLELLYEVTSRVGAPVIASGGAGNVQHMVDAVVKGGASAVLAASIFHFGTHTIAEAREGAESGRRTSSSRKWEASMTTTLGEALDALADTVAERAEKRRSGLVLHGRTAQRRGGALRQKVWRGSNRNRDRRDHG